MTLSQPYKSTKVGYITMSVFVQSSIMENGLFQLNTRTKRSLNYNNIAHFSFHFRNENFCKAHPNCFLELTRDVVVSQSFYSNSRY